MLLESMLTTEPDPPRLPIPLAAVKVSAGFPSPAADYKDRRLDLNEYLIRTPVPTFFFPVTGDSMEGARIFDGDVLVVDRSVRPRDGSAWWLSWTASA